MTEDWRVNVNLMAYGWDGVTIEFARGSEKEASCLARAILEDGMKFGPKEAGWEDGICPHKADRQFYVPARGIGDVEVYRKVATPQEAGPMIDDPA